MALWLLSTRPSRTTPAPTLLAEPSRPSTVGMAARSSASERLPVAGGGTSASLPPPWPISVLFRAASGASPSRFGCAVTSLPAVIQRPTHFSSNPRAARGQLPVLLRATSALSQHHFRCNPPRSYLDESLRSFGTTSGSASSHFRRFSSPLPVPSRWAQFLDRSQSC